MSVVASFLIRESAEVYQAKASEYLTSHQLADFRRCPLLYRKKKLGLVEDEDRPAYLVGRAVHALVLEGRQRFEQEYAVGGPVNPKTGEIYGSNTKAFAEWAAAQSKPVLTVQQQDLVQRMAEGVRQHGLARDLLSEGIPEGVVRAEYTGLTAHAQHNHDRVVAAVTSVAILQSFRDALLLHVRPRRNRNRRRGSCSATIAASCIGYARHVQITFHKPLLRPFKNATAVMPQVTLQAIQGPFEIFDELAGVNKKILFGQFRKMTVLSLGNGRHETRNIHRVVHQSIAKSPEPLRVILVFLTEPAEEFLEPFAIPRVALSVNKRT
jgi:hypothetical protein